jgi:hypothetical protein
MIEKCTHLICGFENRLEYCETEARDEQTAEIVAAVLDELLFDNSDVSSSRYKHENTNESGVSERSFSFLSADGGLLPELDVTLRHERKYAVQSDSYEIEIARRQSNIAGVGKTWQSDLYVIEIYPRGKVYGTIDRINPFITRSGGLEERSGTDIMRAYDYVQLLEELAHVCQLHDIEQVDNFNSLRAHAKLE